MLWGGSEGGEPSGGLGQGGGELELDLDYDNCCNDGLGPGGGELAYLIFVIFFTLAKFLENKIYTEKRQFFALNL